MRQQGETVEVTLLGGAMGPASGEGDFYSMLDAALAGVLEACDAEGGLVRLFPEWSVGDRPLIRLRHGSGEAAKAALARASEIVLQQVRLEGKTVIEAPHGALDHDPECEQALSGKTEGAEDPASTVLGSASHLRSRAAIGVPIRIHGAVHGAVYVERSAPAFPTEVLSVLSWFAQMIEVELRRRRQHVWRWKTVDVSGHLKTRVVA